MASRSACGIASRLPVPLDHPCTPRCADESQTETPSFCVDAGTERGEASGGHHGMVSVPHVPVSFEARPAVSFQS